MEGASVTVTFTPRPARHITFAAGGENITDAVYITLRSNTSRAQRQFMRACLPLEGKVALAPDEVSPVSRKFDHR